MLMISKERDHSKISSYVKKFILSYIILLFLLIIIFSRRFSANPLVFIIIIIALCAFVQSFV